MKYYLMNKNKKVAIIDYNSDVKAIISIEKIYDIEYAPLIVKNAPKNKKII